MLTRQNRCKRPRGWNAKRVHGLADDVFAQHRAKACAAIAVAGVGRGTSTFQLDIAAVARAVNDLANQQRPAIAELSRKPTELVARVNGGD